MEEFQADIHVLVFFITSWAYATVKVTTSGQIIQNVTYSIPQYRSAVLHYIHVFQYTFYRIVSPQPLGIYTAGRGLGFEMQYFQNACL